MTFAHPFVLALIPVALVGIWWTIRRRRGTEHSASYPQIHRLWADGRGLSDRPAARRHRGRGLCLAVGAVAALLALARPQWGEIAEQSYDRSREVMLALDLSRSMLADDVSPNRLARAKLLIDALLDQLKGERVGLTVFAGTAFVQSPLSADYEILREFLTELDPSYLPQGGTDYESMLQTAVQAFGQQGAGDRFLVVLSDGEAHDEGWKALLPSLRERGIHVIGLGVGTPAGGLVPAADGGAMKDAHGNAVLSRLEPATLQELATATGGTYRDAATWVDVAELVNATVAQGTKGDYVEERHVRLQDRFQWFLAPAVLCLLLALWLDVPPTPLARVRQLRTRGGAASASLIAASTLALLVWPTSSQTAAAATEASPPQSVAAAPSQNALADTVADLAAKPALEAPDYARLANDTITFASQPQAPKGPTRTGVIDDALAAVDRGAHADARAADWPALRERLEQLKQVKEEPPSPPQQSQQQQDQQQQGQDGHQDQQQAGGGGQQDQQNQPGKSGGKSGNPQPENSAGDQGSRDPQSSGGDSHAHNDPQQSAEQPPQGDHGRQNDSKQEHANESGDSSASPDTHDAATADADQKPERSKPDTGGNDAAHEMARSRDTQPLKAPEAGLGEQREQPELPRAAGLQAANEQPPASGTRMMGGGRAVSEADGETDVALGEALTRMEHIKDGDAPAVLFDRMNRAEGRPRPQAKGKDW